ncbi:FG-GAP repeat domain-containing protein [Maribacter sp. ACAM166]|uniref:FG-GAP repeat domain-containing protein n=1 Tax=Maribacter sp. ACAM166 TaxID=2508996 RepID=UPI0010FF5A9E|nr:VCBS repeat-containing protein [Maribacter sp. ACAM166]TLP71117.1 VCBS repeat-containing protein [Maribacter sp. ACAM166]
MIRKPNANNMNSVPLKRKLNILVFLSIGVVLLFFSCQNQNANTLYDVAQYNNYCGRCHLPPNPICIPKDIWKNSVLPEMAARMGYIYDGYDPYKNKSPEEQFLIKLSEKYPKAPVIDSITWCGIHDYIISMAPNTISIDNDRNNKNEDLKQFSIRTIDLPKTAVPIITGLQFDTNMNLFNIGDAKGNLYQWPPKNTKSTSEKFSSAITSVHQKQNDIYITEIGILNPSEIPKGFITKISSGVIDTIAKELHRPVFTEILDLNNDGVDELLICEFGNLTGQLTILVEKGSGFVKRPIHNQPGAIKFEIADMNQDGKKDVVALFSQGNEGVFIFYQKNDLQFSSEHIIVLPPEYGSSWFELIDYDIDGHLDIILANGDNADYSLFPKPYHGIRLFLNNKSNIFEQKWFYPIYGATRVLADDYDLDGDIDFAVSALFNDTGSSSDQGFIYLENQNSKRLEFKSYTSKGDFNNGWLTMAKGDYDVDGDIDIMIGGFNVNGLRKTSSIFKSNEDNLIKLILLENKENTIKIVNTVTNSTTD